MPIGVLAAQLIHAAGESSPGQLPPDTYAVCLAVRDEQQLLDLEDRLLCAGIPHNAIREPDPPWSGQLMTIGIQPMPRAALRSLLKRIPTLNERTYEKAVTQVVDPVATAVEQVDQGAGK